MKVACVVALYSSGVLRCIANLPYRAASLLDWRTLCINTTAVSIMYSSSCAPHYGYCPIPLQHRDAAVCHPFAMEASACISTASLQYSISLRRVSAVNPILLANSLACNVKPNDEIMDDLLLVTMELGCEPATGAAMLQNGLLRSSEQPHGCCTCSA